jgi:N-acetylmuramoyl-L-alanine amidase
MCITKVVRGVVIFGITAGVFLWNMQSQKAVALAPVKVSVVEVNPTKLWSDHLHLKKSSTATGAAVTEKESRTEVKKAKKTKNREKNKLKKKKQRKRAAKKKRMAGIKKRCGIKVSTEGISILERIVEAEAGDQGHKGKRLVANVIINRVKSSKFPSTIKGVVFAPRQFSPVTDGAYARAVVTKDTKKAVDEALHGKDDSQGALYFMDRRYADSSNIRWFDRSLTRLFQYNGHEFYK